MRGRLAVALGLAVAAAGLAGCYPIQVAGKTDRIEFVASTVVGGYEFDPTATSPIRAASRATRAS